MSAKEREVVLDDEVTRIHCLAGDMGHDVQTPWTINGDLSASTRCRRCGADAAVRVYPDGHVWSGGRLVYERPCPGAH